MTAQSPTVAPTERSMPPVMMMKVIGNAMRPISVISRPWFKMLSTVRNRLLNAPSARSAITRMTASNVSCRISQRGSLRFGVSMARLISSIPAPCGVGGA